MFVIKDCITLTTSEKNAITVSIDDTKIHKDVEEFWQAIQNLRDLIGPYTIKVKEKEIIIKTKNNFKEVE